MAQTMIIISLCLILIVNVLAAEEQFQTNGSDNNDENGSNKPPENIDEDTIEERGFRDFCKKIFSKRKWFGKKPKAFPPKAPEHEHSYQTAAHQRTDFGEEHSQLPQININTGDSVRLGANLKFFNYDQFSMESFTITGRSIDITFKYPIETLAGTPHISGGTATNDFHQYQLEQIYFNGPSLHSIDGVTYPLEVEFIHKRFEKHLGGSLDVDCHTFPPLSIVSVLFKQSEHDNPELEALLSTIEEVGDPSGMTEIIGSIDLPQWLPIEVPVFYYWYSGELLLPPFTKNVMRFILQTKNTMSAKQLHTLDRIKRPTSGQHPVTLEKENVFHYTAGHVAPKELIKEPHQMSQEDTDLHKQLEAFKSK